MGGVAVFLVTQLAVPAFLLWIGNGYRSRPPVARRIFWGGVVGYAAAILAVGTLLVLPPVYWGTDGDARWSAIQWAPLVLPVLTAGVALAGSGPGSD